MLHESTHHESASSTQWLPSGLTRHRAHYKLIAVCEDEAAQHIETLLLKSLKARGADVRITRKPVPAMVGARTQICLAIAAGTSTRGTIAALVNQMGGDPAVHSVRWETDPHAS